MNNKDRLLSRSKSIKLPKRKVTVDELLHTDEIVDLLKDINEHRSEIDQFFLVYVDRNAISHFWWHGSRERLLWSLESAKLQLISGEFDE